VGGEKMLAVCQGIVKITYKYPYKCQKIYDLGFFYNRQQW